MVEQVNIINFMGIKNKKYELSEITNFFGSNAQGKTTVFKALLTAFFGPGRNFKSLINNEETRACIRVWVRMPDTEDLLLLERNLSLDGGQSASLVNASTGKPVRRMADIIKEHFNPEMFSPEKILGENVEKKILSLVDVPVAVGEIVNLPIDTQDYDLTLPGLKVLNMIEKSMIKHRESLSRDVKRSKGAMETQENLCSERTKRFTEEHQLSPKDIGPHSEIQEERLKLQVKLKAVQDNFEVLMSEYGKKEKLRVEKKNQLEKNRAETERLKRDAEILKEKIISSEKMDNYLLSSLVQAEKVCSDAVKPDEPIVQNDILKKISELKTRENLALTVQGINGEIKRYKSLVSDYESEKMNYTEYCGKQFDKFKKLKKEKMAKVSEKVPGLKCDSDGVLFWKDLPVTGLSTSEQMELGMLLQLLRSSRGSIIFFDRAESLDESTIHRLEERAKEKGVQLILTSVSDSPLGGDWLNHKVERED